MAATRGGGRSVSRRHYLDNASTQPLRPEAREAMVEHLDSPAGDPARIHAEGMETRGAIEGSREAVAALFRVRPRSVIFCSGATEAIAAAAYGVRSRGAVQIVSAVEHSAVRTAAAQWGQAFVVGVDRTGLVDPAAVAAALAEVTASGESAAVVHMQFGNHETGTEQPIARIAEVCRSAGVLLHVDAAQAVGRVPVSMDELGCDLLSFSAHKFGGPTGIGGLVVRRGLRIDPLLLGADQERARRAGLEHALGIVGLGAVAEVLTPDRLVAEGLVGAAQRDEIEAAALAVDGVELLGHPTQRLPHLSCLGLAGVEPQGVLLGLDAAGIAAHSGSACSSESLEPSPVLEAMGVDAHRSLRLSVGWATTDADVAAFGPAFVDVIGRLRSLAGRG